MLTVSRRWECGGKSPGLSRSSVWCCNLFHKAHDYWCSAVSDFCFVTFKRRLAALMRRWLLVAARCWDAESFLFFFWSWPEENLSEGHKSPTETCLFSVSIHSSGWKVSSADRRSLEVLKTETVLWTSCFELKVTLKKKLMCYNFRPWPHV